MHRSNRQSLRSLLPHYAPNRIRPVEQILDQWQLHALDGQTIGYGLERIRIRGLKTPKSTESGGQEAIERLSQLLREGPIRIVPHGKDVFDRTIADVFVNGENVVSLLKAEQPVGANR
ncbi:MAG TPA: hypothetical protein VH681_07050 [Nitrospiraceae bacterium]|jgi:hypothetical protein